MSFDVKELGDLYPWTPKQFKLADGHTMSYLDEGPQDGEVLLMCHGNPTWSFYYREVVKRFSSRYRCIVPDHMGSGLSDKPQDYPYTLGQHIDNLEALTKHLGLTRVNMVIHDWGGAIGMGWAVRDPSRLLRVAVLNTLGKPVIAGTVEV